MWGTVALLAGQALLGTNSQTKVAEAQNKAAMAQLGKQMNELHLQRSQVIQQTSDALFNLDIQTDQAQGQAQLNAAASGTMGASVKDAVSTINTVADANKAGINRQLDASLSQNARNVYAAVDSAHNSMDWESGADKMWNNVLSASGKLVGQAAASAFDGTVGTKIGTSIGHAWDAAADFGVDAWNKSGVGDVVSSWKSYLG